MKAKHDKREKKFQLGVRLVDNKIPKYNSKKDPMCPIRFKRKSKRRKLMENKPPGPQGPKLEPPGAPGSPREPQAALGAS